MANIYGTNKADILRGTFSDDYISGGAGNDTIYGNGGKDALFGDAGDDTIYTGVDSGTTVNGGAGNDKIYSGGGISLIQGGDEDDSFYFEGIGSQSEQFQGGSGYDVVYATKANQVIGFDQIIGIEEISSGGYANVSIQTSDTTYASIDLSGVKLTNMASINGQAGNNVIVLEGGYLNADPTLARNELVHGGDGNDIILSGYGNDTVYGDAGDDKLAGGAGADILIGGSGADIFAVEYLADSQVGNADKILDFSRSEGDRIRISDIDANTNVANDQAFTFIGTASFTNTAGQLRYAVDSQGAHVYGDVNGDGVADFEIAASGTSSFVSSDFIL